MQPAHLGVDVAQPGGEARNATRGGEGLGGILHRHRQRAVEGDRPAIARCAILRQVEERLLGCFELLAGIELGLCAKGAVHHHLAQVDQLPAQPGIVHDSAVFAGIDDADHGREQLRQIRRPAHFIEQAGVFEFGAQRDDIGQLPRFHAALDTLEDAAMDRVGEVFGGQELADSLIGFVVGQQRAEQRLLRRHVGRRQALRQAKQAAAGGIDFIHGVILARLASRCARGLPVDRGDDGDGRVPALGWDPRIA